MAQNAFVTLATTDEYAIGALNLAQSLRNVGTSADLVILVTSGVSAQIRDALSSVFTKLVDVAELNSENHEILELIQRPELGATVTKIHAWKLTEYSKCVFLDADCLVLQSVDELFERPQLSAVCDLGWPDCFNSGVFVLVPEQQVFDQLVQLLQQQGTFDGGDQGLLNAYFGADWLNTDIQKRLPFIYNMHASSVYTYTPAFRKYGDQIKIVHFLGAIKPWMYNYNSTTGNVVSAFSDVHHLPHVQTWWNVFITQVRPKLPSDLLTPNLLVELPVQEPETEEHVQPEEHNQPEDTGIAGQLANLDVSKPMDDFERKKNWEAGHIDYLGADSFDNIQKKLDEAIGK